MTVFTGGKWGCYHKLGPLYPPETWVVLDVVGGGQLAAGGDAEGEEALVQDWAQVGARGVDCGGVGGGAGADYGERSVHAAGWGLWWSGWWAG